MAASSFPRCRAVSFSSVWFLGITVMIRLLNHFPPHFFLGYACSTNLNTFKETLFHCLIWHFTMCRRVSPWTFSGQRTWVIFCLSVTWTQACNSALRTWTGELLHVQVKRMQLKHHMVDWSAVSCCSEKKNKFAVLCWKPTCISFPDKSSSKLYLQTRTFQTEQRVEGFPSLRGVSYSVVFIISLLSGFCLIIVLNWFSRLG